MNPEHIETLKETLGIMQFQESEGWGYTVITKRAEIIAALTAALDELTRERVSVKFTDNSPVTGWHLVDIMHEFVDVFPEEIRCFVLSREDERFRLTLERLDTGEKGKEDSK
jgi:hypothetical protein